MPNIKYSTSKNLSLTRLHLLPVKFYFKAILKAINAFSFHSVLSEISNLTNVFKMNLFVSKYMVLDETKTKSIEVN